MTHEARILREPITVADVVKNGYSFGGNDGDLIPIFDSTYAFVTLKVKDGIAKEVHAGPFYPPKK